MANNLFEQNWPSIAERMLEHGVDELPIRIFQSHYRQLVAGDASFIGERDIQPVAELPDLDQLPADLEQLGAAALSQTAVLRLNGGLGTGMGLAGPKSLLPLRDGMTFLDFIMAQARSLGVPLLLMNSFATQDATQRYLDAMRSRAERPERLITFLQHRVPKIRADDFTAAQWSANPELGWCPPGHGDLYAAIATSGTLDRLLSGGYRYLFVANADNLGATLDLRVLGYLRQQQHSFLMEVADRTEADRKGGHLARVASTGTLLLRERAQCREEELSAFQDIARYRYFNTNNLWIDLHALADALHRHSGALPLPLIANRKTLDPADADSPAVFQLETAMGSAISVLAGAAALRVPRRRFAPVKSTSDLLAVRSDAYRVDEHYAIRLIDDRGGVPPVVSLDERYYRSTAELDRRIRVCPSLRACTSLAIKGPIELHQPTQFLGVVELTNRSERPVELAGGQWSGPHVV